MLNASQFQTAGAKLLKELLPKSAKICRRSFVEELIS